MEERESGILGALTAMGLRPSAYWLSVLLPEALVACLHAALLAGAAWALRFDLATRNSFGLLLVLLMTT